MNDEIDEQHFRWQFENTDESQRAMEHYYGVNEEQGMKQMTYEEVMLLATMAIQGPVEERCLAAAELADMVMQLQGELNDRQETWSREIDRIFGGKTVSHA